MMNKAEIEKEIQKQMKVLKLSRKEAEELVMEDMEIDHMTMKEIQSDLTADQKKAIKSHTKTTTGEKKATTTRERKKDEEKLDLIQKIFDFISKNTKNAEIIKPEREISFTIGENEYSLTLTKHRKAKK